MTGQESYIEIYDDEDYSQTKLVLYESTPALTESNDAASSFKERKYKRISRDKIFVFLAYFTANALSIVIHSVTYLYCSGVWTSYLVSLCKLPREVCHTKRRKQTQR